MEKLLTPREVCALLRVSPRTLRRLVASYALRCVRFGRAVRFDQADVIRFVTARKE